MTEKGPPSFGVRGGIRERGPPNLGATQFPPLVARLRREFYRCSARKTKEKCTESLDRSFIKTCASTNAANACTSIFRIPKNVSIGERRACKSTVRRLLQSTFETCAPTANTRVAPRIALTKAENRVSMHDTQCSSCECAHAYACTRNTLGNKVECAKLCMVEHWGASELR